MGYRWNRLDEPIFVAALDFRMTRLLDYENATRRVMLATKIVDVISGTTLMPRLAMLGKPLV